MKPVREPDAGKPHVRFDEEGRETRDGLLGEWTPTRKGGNSGAPPDLYTTALALHSTERTHDVSRTALGETLSAVDDLRQGDTAALMCGAEPEVSLGCERLAGDGIRG